MTAIPTELTIDNSAVVLIDHQPWVAFSPVNWQAVLSEWTPDITSPERGVLTDVLVAHGGATSLAIQYMMAQIAAGLVPAPAFATDLAR